MGSRRRIDKKKKKKKISKKIKSRLESTLDKFFPAERTDKLCRVIDYFRNVTGEVNVI